jgi:H+/Cl- antiporter ClcA
MCPLVSVGAALAGMMRLPLTTIVFSLKLTHSFARL